MNGLNTGKYIWYINDTQLIRSMKSMKVGEKYESPIFEMAGMKWVIILFPNDKEEQIKAPTICLKPLFSDEWDTIVFLRSMHCTEDGRISTMLSSKSNGEHTHYRTMCSVNELSQQQSITINVSVSIIKIITKQSSSILSRYRLETKPLFPIHHQFSYAIDAQLLQKFKKLPHGKYTVSPLYDNMWCMRFYPNGQKGADGYASYYLSCLNFFHQPINVRFNLECTNVGDECNVNQEVIFSEQHKHFGCSKWFEVSKLAKCETLTIEVDLTITGFSEQEQKLDTNKDQKEHDMHEIADELQISSILQQHIQKELISVIQKDESKQDESKELKSLTNKINYVSSTMQQIQSANNELTQKMHSMNTQLTEYESTNNKLQQELTNSKLINNELTQKLNSITQNMNQLQQKQEAMNGSLSTSLSSMKKKYDKMETEMKKLLVNQSDNDEIKEEPDEEKVRKWLENIKLSQYFDIFIEQGFDDMESIRELTMQDLNDINIDKLGHKKKIIRAVQMLNNQQKSQHVAPQPAYAAQNNNIASKSAWICSNCQWKNVPHMRLCAQCGVKKMQYVGVEGVNVQDTV